MPKLTENVLIGGRVRLEGEEISEAEAKNVRPEVFLPEDASDADDQAGENPDQSDAEDASDADDQAKQPRSRRKPASSK